MAVQDATQSPYLRAHTPNQSNNSGGSSQSNAGPANPPPYLKGALQVAFSPNTNLVKEVVSATSYVTPEVQAALDTAKQDCVSALQAHGGKLSAEDMGQLSK